MTLLELVITIGIMLVLASAAVPLARVAVQRQKERQLRLVLREIRTAIDRYKDDADKNLIRTEVGSQGYPPDLQTLVNGVSLSTGTPGATGGVSASALAGASGTAQFGSFGTPQLPSGGTSGFSTPGSTSNQSSVSDLPNKVRYLRKIPVDPMTGKDDWGLRALGDDPDSRSWGGHNVFDIYSQSDATATNGTKYSDW